MQDMLEEMFRMQAELNKRIGIRPGEEMPVAIPRERIRVYAQAV